MMLVFIITFILFWILAVLSRLPCPTNIDYVSTSPLLNVKTNTWLLIYANHGNAIVPNTTDASCVS